MTDLRATSASLVLPSELAGRLYVRDAQGQLIAEGNPAQVTSNDKVVEAYLGHGTAARLRKAAAAKGAGA